MSIASEITRIQNNIADAYDALEDKGATMPVTENTDNLVSTINTISGDGTSSKYGATIDDFFGDTDADGVLQAPTGSMNLVFTGVEGIGADVLAEFFIGNERILTASFPDLIEINIRGLFSAFSGCSNLTTLDLSALTTVDESGLDTAFAGCLSLASVDLSALTTVVDYGLASAFAGCSSLASVDLSALTTVGEGGLISAFFDCSSLTTISFPALTSASLESYAYQFEGMLQGCSGVTVHFPSNLQSVIGSWSDVTNGFRGTNTTILFDLPATS